MENEEKSEKKVKIFKAPEIMENPDNYPTVFLAGSIEMGKAALWQDVLISGISHLPVVVMNPRRDSWDSSWQQCISNPLFKEQVDWELNALENSTFVAMYFDPQTKSPITLMELGLAASQAEKLIVSCGDGFWRKGNVEIVCDRYNIPLVESLEDLIASLETKINNYLERQKEKNVEGRKRKLTEEKCLEVSGNHTQSEEAKKPNIL